MNKLFYPKLAASNIKKNFKLYFPYMLTCVFTVAMFYIMRSLSQNVGLESAYGGGTAQEILELGSVVIAFFAFIFLFYTNSFLTKNRKKEFGLFNILGMEKRHIVRVIAYESLFSALVSLVFGIGAGILLDKLMFAVILRIMNAEIPLGFHVSFDAIIFSVILFGVIFFLIFLNSVRIVRLSKPIELLSGSKTGEKEPKAKFFITFLGLVFLGAGYYIALTVQNPVTALTLFFAAVISVIIGTYLLFTSGSIALLKILKSNKRYYYKTNHFISVSGMMYRMKQNAVGLANICILSTMVLVMVSSTTSLVVGSEDILRSRYPRQLEVTSAGADTEKLPIIIDKINELAEEKNVTIKNELSYTSLEFSAVFDGKNAFNTSTDYDMTKMGSVYVLFIVTADDYSAFSGEKRSLAPNEIILWYDREKYDSESITLLGENYYIAEFTDKFISSPGIGNSVLPTLGIVVDSTETLEKICKYQENSYGKNSSRIRRYYGFDTELSAAEQKTFYRYLGENLYEYRKTEDIYFFETCREIQRENDFSLFGSLFFLGIFLGLIFTVATVLIIYYKQISEGYDDKARFEIMQKVGLSEGEVKSSIHSQVVTVFFLPLITAGVHTAVAFPIVCKLLRLFNLFNTGIFLACTIGVFAAFALIYAVIYALTARVYYRIVRW